MSASRLTPLAVRLLALLAERDMHAYEMYQLLIKRAEDRQVKVRPGSLYHTVERLADHGLVQPVGVDREGNRPERTRYSLTEAGAQALQTWVVEMLRAPVNEYPRFPVALDEAHHLPREKVVACLGKYTDALAAEIEEIVQGVEQVNACGVPEAYWMSWSYLLEVKRTELDWIRRQVERIKNEELEWPKSPIQNLRRS
ncbi:MAG TPA: PadR family transcriptional regulator [Microlunatus sp.]|nr:PadR family transcriptional regulator [Microlunatus sp.]